MRRKSAKLYAIALAAAVMSSACIPTAQLMAKKELNEELSEDETEEEEAVEEDVQKEQTAEQWAAEEESASPPGNGGVEEEAQTGAGKSEETQAEPDVSQEESGADENGQDEPGSDDAQDGEETQDSTDEEDDGSDDGDYGKEESKEEKDTETSAESENTKEEANTSESDQSYDDAGTIGDEITDDSSTSSKKESKKKKKSSKKKESESSREADSNEGTVDIIGKETEEEEETEESEGEPVWDYSGTVSGGTYWDQSWYVQEDFRFSQVDKVPVISEGEIEGVSVYSATDNSQKVVGILPYFSIAYVLDDDVDGNWLYVESGNVRGFIKADEVAADDYAEDLIDEIGEDNFTSGYMTCEKADNDAFTYTKTTVYDVLADKVYAVSLVKGDIYEYPSTDSRAVGESGSGTLAYVLEETDDGWMFVESGDVRGFIQSSSILSGDLAESIVNSIGEDEIVKATQLIEPEENRSLYYTLKSVFTTADSLGEKIAEYALSLVGQTKYVWGGTSLIFGADCSGFTQSVFASFGINIPRLAENQGASGEVVASLADAKPGDIIYYSSGPHVGIYIGNGQVVQCSGGSANTASNPGRGATVSAADYMHITSIRRYIIPTNERKISGSANADPTNYTQDQLELIWAIVAQEDNGSYEGALAVISSAMNRVDSPQWASLGSNALAQLTAPGQYCYSIDLNWMPRLGGNVPDYVKQAVSDCLDKGIRNHSHTSFRSYYTAGSEQIAGGNYYFN